MKSFQAIPSHTFLSGSTTIFDLFVKISDNKYIKVLHKGDEFEKSRLDKYISEKKAKFFYFKNEDRVLYMNLYNKILAQLNKKESVPSSLKASMSKSIADKFISAAHTEGMSPRMVEEGKLVCENMYEMFRKDKDFSKILDSFSESIENGEDRSFLVSFFSIAIGSQISWITSRNSKILGMGAMLHEIGKLKLDDALKNIDLKEATPEDTKLYKQYPKHGAEILDEYPFIEQAVKQIVKQHKENLDGSGYPLGLTSIRIFPLAKIVGLASAFTDLLLEGKDEPKKILENFVKEPQNLVYYDNDIVRALMMSFTDGKKVKAA